MPERKDIHLHLGALQSFSRLSAGTCAPRRDPSGPVSKRGVPEAQHLSHSRGGRRGRGCRPASQPEAGRRIRRCSARTHATPSCPQGQGFLPKAGFER